MKTFQSFPRFVWALVGLLAIAAGILSLGKREIEANPSAESYDPSGTSAFAAVLRKAGYDVRIDKRSNPRYSPDEVAVFFRTPGFPEYNAAPRILFEENFLQQVRRGARGISLSVPYDYLRVSRALLASKPIEVGTSSPGPELRLHVQPMAPWDVDRDSPSVVLWTTPNDQLVRAYQLGLGRMIVASDATFVTNRFIDKVDNAKAALRLVSLLARPGDKIVFAEAALGNAEDPGLLEVIGAWALSAWRQLLFLGVVVAYTLGKRFGIPDESRPPQRGARELLDGLTDTYTRGRHTRAAMGAALDRADHDIRRALRLPRDATRADRDELLPQSLRQALARLQAAYEAEHRVSSRDALALVVKAREETDTFVRGSRATMAAQSSSHVQ